MVIRVTNALATKVSASTPSNIHSRFSSSGVPALTTEPGAPSEPARNVHGEAAADAADCAAPEVAAVSGMNVLKPSCAAARPLPMTCGTTIETRPVTNPAIGICHISDRPVGLCDSAHCEPLRNSAPTTPHAVPHSSANSIRLGVLFICIAPMS